MAVDSGSVTRPDSLESSIHSARLEGPLECEFDSLVAGGIKGKEYENGAETFPDPLYGSPDVAFFLFSH